MLKLSAKGVYGMKRILTVLLILICAFAFTACGNNGEDTAEYLEILESGTYTLECIGVYGGQNHTVRQYVDGTTISTAFRNELDSTMVYMYEDGAYYLYDSNAEIYARMEGTGDVLLLDYVALNYDYSTAVYQKTKKQQVTGITYEYDIYSLQTVDGEETVMELYIDPEHGGLYAIAFPNESISMTVADFSAEIPDHVLMGIPEHYTEVSPDQIMSMITL